MSAAKQVLRALLRRRRPVVFGDLNRVEPTADAYGFYRGMPIDRYYIEAYLRANRSLIRGRCLEVGELRYLDQFADAASEKSIIVPKADVAKPDARTSAHSLVVADLTKPDSLPASTFDCFVCTQTLNFVYDVKGAIQGAHRLLAAGGVFLGTVAGIAQISRYDMDRWGDYWRFTNRSLQLLLGETFGADVRISTYGNALAAQALLQGVVVEDLPNPSLLQARAEDYQVVIGFMARRTG